MTAAGYTAQLRGLCRLLGAEYLIVEDRFLGFMSADADFVFLNRGAFPKTPSGKAQRYRFRELAAQTTVGTRVTLGRA
jgi:hypothetical protein